MVACLFWVIVVLHWMLKLLMYGLLHLSASPWCFCSRTFFLKKRIEPIAMNPVCIGFTYWTQDNQHECFRLSNWRCWGPWVNPLCLPPVWWSTVRFIFLNDSWCVSLLQWGGIFYGCFAYIVAFIHYLSFTYYFSSHVSLPWDSFFLYKSTLYCHIL